MRYQCSAYRYHDTENLFILNILNILDILLVFDEEITGR